MKSFEIRRCVKQNRKSFEFILNIYIKKMIELGLNL
jgi:hypothetical protein